jgi:tetratricopeptide (TPR) repeat protein
MNGMVKGLMRLWMASCIEAKLNTLPAEVDVACEEHVDLLAGAASVYFELAQFAKCLALRERVLGLLDGASEKYRTKCAHALNMLCEVHHELGKFDEGRAAVERSMAICKESGDTGSDVYAAALYYMARVDRDWNRCIEFYGKSLEIYTANNGEEHETCAMVLKSLGIRQKAMGYAGGYGDDCYDKAKDYLERSLCIYRTLRGGRYIKCAEVMQYLGTTLQNMGEVDAAVKNYEDALVIYEATHGADHRRCAGITTNLGTVYRENKGDYDKALEDYGRALVIQEATYGTDHEVVGRVCRHMSKAHEAKGDLAQALHFMERALPGYTGTRYEDWCKGEVDRLRAAAK